MRALTFLVDRFAWTPFSKTLPDADDAPSAGSIGEGLVAFLHVEAGDVAEERRRKVFRKTLKHLKWLANKRGLEAVVLHSFTHLGGQSAPADEARAFLEELAARLSKTGYRVEVTPFGWFSSWRIDVRGESLAKVYQEL
ncbi:MAG TPA: threonyl-tRNA synthetase editing domain-containing protein [Sandaracinaceae bacterium LLY-WYZ-13_1]|nr:threonyl-tRNA synthetase editing domain-containing protein [Sandaracinaceae bacterium LLY-WYZ-13_1]